MLVLRARVNIFAIGEFSITKCKGLNQNSAGIIHETEGISVSLPRPVLLVSVCYICL